MLVKKLICLDPGLVNFAFLVMEKKSGRISDHGVVNLGRRYRRDTHKPLMRFLSTKMESLLKENNVEAIVVEKQLKNPYIEQVATIRTWCDMKKITFCSVSPYSMKCYYHVATGNYTKNKQAVVQLVTEKLSSLADSGIDIDSLNHHLADAYLLGMYYKEKVKSTKK